MNDTHKTQSAEELRKQKVEAYAAWLERFVEAAYRLYQSHPGSQVECRVCREFSDASANESIHTSWCVVERFDQLLSDYAALTNGKEDGK